MLSQKPRPIRFACCKRKEHEEIVRPHLAYSPQELDELRRSGKAISNSAIESLYYDGEVINGDFSLPLDSQRGVDINDMWERSQAERKTRYKTGISNVRSVDFNVSK